MDQRHQQKHLYQQNEPFVGRQQTKLLSEEESALESDSGSFRSDNDFENDDNNNNNIGLFTNKRDNDRSVNAVSSLESADNYMTTDEECSAAAPTDEERSLMYPQSSASCISTPTDEEDFISPPPATAYTSPFDDQLISQHQQQSSSPNRIATPPRHPYQQQHPQRQQHQPHHQQQQQYHGTSQEAGGGRLWRLAGEIAAGKAPSSLLGKSPNAKANLGQLKESFMERMRSRADPDALVAPPTPPRPNRTYTVCACPITVIALLLYDPLTVSLYHHTHYY